MSQSKNSRSGLSNDNATDSDHPEVDQNQAPSTDKRGESSSETLNESSSEDTNVYRQFSPPIDDDMSARLEQSDYAPYATDEGNGSNVGTPPSSSLMNTSPDTDSTPRDTPLEGVLFGIAGSGKTSFMRAINQACTHIPREEKSWAQFRYIPREETTRLEEDMVSILSTQKAEYGSSSFTEYPFDLSLNDDQHLSMVISDGPGGALFPLPSGELSESAEAHEHRSNFVNSGRKANVIVLLLDANSPHQRALVKSHLPGILSDILVEYPISKRLDVRVRRFIREVFFSMSPNNIYWQLKRRNRSSTKALAAEHFLILLNKIELVCDRHVINSRDNQPSYIRQSALDVAHLVDPVKQAKKCIGLGILKAINNHLRPKAKLAVGVISAYGFQRNGEIFAPSRLPQEFKTDGHIFDMWRPFGIRDALYFMVTGKTRRRGRVRLVHAEDLLDD